MLLVYDKLQRHEEALKQYEEAARLEPENPVLRDNLGLAQKESASRNSPGPAIGQSSEAPAQVQAAAPPEMTIGAAVPMEAPPYMYKHPKQITLKNGRSIIGDIVEQDNQSLWLEVGENMRTRLSRDEVERIEEV